MTFARPGPRVVRQVRPQRTMSGFVATGIFFAAALSIGAPASSLFSSPASTPASSPACAPSIVPIGVLFQESRTQAARPSDGSLARALALFSGADANHDGKLTAEEARSLPVSTEAFGAEDADRDGFWSREEFLLFYRRQLVASRQPVGADLDAEITRIQALKRVEAVDPARKPKCETSARTADPSSLNQRFETILADVEAKCASRRAGREDFQRLRNLVVLNGRAAAKGSAEPGSGAQSAMLDAIDRIERHSVQGQYSRDEFETLRRASCPEKVPTSNAHSVAVPRDSAEPPDGGRAAVKTSPTPTRAPSPPSATNPGTAPVQPGPPSAPPGPAAGRQRTSPPPTPPPKPAPRPTPVRPSNDPSDRSKP